MAQEKITTLNDLKVAFDELKALNPLLELETRKINNIDYNVFKNAPKTFRDLYNLIQLLHGDFPFVNENNKQESFSDILQKSKNLANYLSKKGLKPGDSVGICMQNCSNWIIAFLGITAHGATCVPFNSWWTSKELEYGINHSDVKLIFVDKKRYLNVKELQVEVVTNENIPKTIDFNDTIADHCDDWPSKNSSELDVSVLLYTSGSTGLPKGVMLSHLSLINALLGFYTLGELRQHVHQETLLQVDNASVIINVPLFHVTGLITQFLLSMLAKRNMILMSKWDTEEALKIIEKFKVTNISGVPTQSWDILKHPNVDNYDLSSLIDIGAGGAARPEDQVKELNNKFNIPLTFGWGMTETSAIGTIHRGEDYLKRPTSCGLNVPYLTELSIIDEKWNFLKSKEIGEIVFKSPTNMQGYLKNDEETQKTIKDGWLKTGDLGFIDDDGYLFIVDRKKALIIRGGENISTLEVENNLDKHDGVLESCACGIPDEKFGEIVGALIYTTKKIDEDEIKDFLSKTLATYKIPEIIKFTDKPLPRIASEKIDRVGIKDILSS